MNDRFGRADALALAAYAVLAGIFFWPILFGNAILTGYDTFTIFYPLRSAVSAALLNGRLPLWNPSPFLGTPLLANPQVAALYPVNLPFYFLPTGPSLAWTMVAHIFLAAAFMYGFMLIETGVGRAPAWLAGALFAWGGFMGQQTGHINQVSVAAWLPLLLLLGGRTWRSPTRRRVAALAVAVALQLLAGHSQESYMNLAALAAYVTFLTVHRYGWRRFLSGRRSVLAVAAAVALGVALAAVQLVPTLELTRLSIRSGGLTFRTASSFSLQPADLLSALLPNYGGPPPIETAAYAGVTGLLLAIIGLLFYQRRPPARFAVLLGTVALLLALGRYSPLYWVAYYVVPGVGLFRAPARWLMLFSAAVAMLAGMGLDVLLARSWRAERRRALVVIVVCITVAFVIVVAGQGRLRMPAGWVAVAWAAVAMLFLAALAADVPARRPGLFIAALVLTSILELYAAGRFLEYSRVSIQESLTALRPALAYLQTQVQPAELPQVLSVSDATWDPGDLASIRSMFGEGAAGRAADYVDAVKNKELLTANLSGLYGVDSVDGYDGGVLPVRRYVDLEALLLPSDQLSPDGRLRDHLAALPDARLLSILGADYAIADKNGDAWIDNVYYDLAFVAPVTQSLTLTVTQPVVATAIGLVSRIEGAGQLPPGTVAGAIDVKGRDGRLASLDVVVGQTTDVEGAASDLRTVTTPTGESYFYARVALPQAQVPELVTIRFDEPSGALAVRSLSIIDQRTGASLGVTVAPDFRRVHDGDVKVYRNERAQPRAYIVHRTQQVQGIAAVDAMRQAGFDPAQEVIIGSPPPPLGEPKGAETATIARYEPERVVIDANLSAPGLLVLADAHYPGWEVKVDGQAAPIMEANYYFRGVALNEGQHRVEFAFRPRSLYAGALISLLALGVLVALLLPQGKGKRQQVR